LPLIQSFRENQKSKKCRLLPHRSQSVSKKWLAKFCKIDPRPLGARPLGANEIKQIFVQVCYFLCRIKILLARLLRVCVWRQKCHNNVSNANNVVLTQFMMLKTPKMSHNYQLCIWNTFFKFAVFKRRLWLFENLGMWI
jgi:hypothetical protein